jgi:hypothetical protein
MDDTKWTIQSIGTTLKLHISKDEERDKKTDAMFKIIVTGNGVPALPEVVRGHTKWIEDQTKKSEEEEKRRFEYKKGIILLAIGQALTLIIGAAAVILKK